MKEESCCTVTCDLPIDGNYWNNQYQTNTTNWDLGQVSPALKQYIDSIQNKNSAILIPGCGNSYEAEYLLSHGFTNVTLIDIAPILVETLKNKFHNNPNITIILGDFFEHQGAYDIILEQTFFCALPPFLRQKYVWKMHQLLAQNGILAGLLFNRRFEAGPPFGGSQEEYEQLFSKAFHVHQMAPTNLSVPSRLNTELFIEFSKNTEVQVLLYQFTGITCNGCMQTVTTKFKELDGVYNASMSTNFAEVLIVSDQEVPLDDLQKIVSYDEHYKIIKAS